MAYEKYAYVTHTQRYPEATFTLNVFSLRSSSSLCVVFCLFSHIAVVVVEVFHVSLAKRAVVVTVVAVAAAVAAVVIYHACTVAADVTHKPYITAHTHTHTQQDTQSAISARERIA